jgi:hypothetical protein
MDGCTSLTRSGIDIDERTKETLRLLAELTAPQSMETLHTLVEMLPTLGALVRQAPGADRRNGGHRRRTGDASA